MESLHNDSALTMRRAAFFAYWRLNTTWLDSLVSVFTHTGMKWQKAGGSVPYKAGRHQPHTLSL